MRDVVSLRRAAVWLIANLALTVVVRGAEPPVTSKPMVGVASVASTVSDLDRAVAFYTDVLDFERFEPAESVDHSAPGESSHRSTWLRLGEEVIELRQFCKSDGRPYPDGSRSNDLWFQHLAIVVSDMQKAYQRLRAARVVHISPGPQELPEWNLAAAGIEAFYFRDPDGHPLELIAYPPGKGQAKWHADSDSLFLGIDHTAIAVSDTERALRFYRDELGLQVVGGSENYGDEQEHLNGVFGSRVRITALRGPSGPGVELLEYIAPPGGRAPLAAVRPHDLAFRETRLSVTHPTDGTGLFEVQSIRDPDGHPVRIVRQ